MIITFNHIPKNLFLFSSRFYFLSFSKLTILFCFPSIFLSVCPANLYLCLYLILFHLCFTLIFVFLIFLYLSFSLSFFFFTHFLSACFCFSLSLSISLLTLLFFFFLPISLSLSLSLSPSLHSLAFPLSHCIYISCNLNSQLVTWSQFYNNSHVDLEIKK